MSKISRDNNRYSTGYIYKQKNITTKDACLQWIWNCAHKEQICCLYIEVSDGKSYHEGTISRPYSIGEFKENFEQIQKGLDEFISLIMIFKYHGKKNYLLIDLETYEIEMWALYKNSECLPELESIFGLLE